MNINTNGHNGDGFSLNGNGSPLNGSIDLTSVPGATSKYTPSSKRNPCPVCQRVKDGDCRVGEFGNLALCHTFQDGRDDETRNGYRFIRASDKGAGWGVWGWGEKKGKKGYRPSVEPQTVYQYPDRDGNPLIRVTRQKGKQPEFYQSYFVEGVWLTASKVADTVKAEMRGRVPLYRYAEVRAAIERDEAIVFVEGEKCADELWKIGVPATTSIGGSKSYSTWGNYSADLAGARLILGMPDRDQVGMKYLEAVMKDQPIHHWIKAFPKSPLWGIALPEDGGLDVADWIGEGATKGDVLALIRDLRKEVDGGAGNSEGRHPSSTSETSTLSSFAGKNRKVDASHDIQESKAEIAVLEGKLKARLDLSTVLPSEIASLLNQVARAMPTAPEALLTTFLAIVASLIGTSSSFAIPSRNWIEPTIIWSMIVADSGKLKSPTQKTLFDPLKRLQKDSARRYKENHKRWEQDKKAFEADKANKGQIFDFDEPTKKEYYVSDTTIEALGMVHSENPRGFLRFQDEIDGFYAQHNKYRAGAGDDEQVWLSINSGGGFKVNRMSRKFELFSTAISMTGSIQPETLAKHNNAARNGTGMNSRWFYCMVPMPRAFPTGEVVPETTNFLLTDLYRKLALIPSDIEEIKDREGNVVASEPTPRIYQLSKDAMRVFESEWEIPMVIRESKETNGGMQKILNKYKGFCGRIACLLHLLEYVAGLPPFEECEATGIQFNPPRQIEEATIRRAIATTSFYIKQAEIMYGISTNDDEDMTPAMIRLKEISLKLSGESQGWISPKIAKQQTRLIKSADHAKSLFAEMHESGFGELDTTGRTPKWRFIGSEDEIASTCLPEYSDADIERLVEVYTQGGAPQATESTVYPDAPPKESPFPEPKQPEPKEDFSVHYSDENIANLVEVVQAAIEEGCPDVIDSFFEPTPIKIREQIKELVMSIVNPASEPTQTAPEMPQPTQQPIDLNNPAASFVESSEGVAPW